MATKKKKENNLSFNKIKNFNIVIVGLGGTGSHLVSSLCQLLGGSTSRTIDCDITLIDGDIVETKNLRNQKYLPEDVGKKKAEVLYKRYQNIYPSIDISFVPKYIENKAELSSIFNNMNKTYNDSTLNVLIGCVDNLSARKIMDDFFNNRITQRELLYIDTGNGIGNLLNGQTVIGRSRIIDTAEIDGIIKTIPSRIEVMLPPPSFYFPEICSGEDEPEEPSCGDTGGANMQNLGANIMSACNVFNILNNLLYFKEIPGSMFLFDAKKNSLSKAI